MEEAKGTQLGEVWDSMVIDSKLQVGKDIVALERKLLSLSFTSFVIPDNSQSSGTSLIREAQLRKSLFC